jgi:hypothetical protein
MASSVLPLPFSIGAWAGASLTLVSVMFWSWIELLMFAVCEVGFVGCGLRCECGIGEMVAGCLGVSWIGSDASFDIVIGGIALAIGL